MPRAPRLLITLGDPLGVGPEIAAAAKKAFPHARLVGPRAFHADIETACEALPKRRGPCAEAGAAAMAALRMAAGMCQGGEADAVVTAPISKEALKLAGEPFPGHTEFFAKVCAVRRPVMAFSAGDLFVSLVTIHIPLKRVPMAVTREAVLSAIERTDAALREWFGKSRPHIAVCGLNPHAGEGGIFGREEIKVIGPAIEEARKKNIDATGPHPADSLFAKRDFDGAVAMYHDQGLVAVKALAWKTAVNVTLGLPFVRTSPDHGTAFDIAGSGKADPTSMIEAVKLADRIVRAKAKGNLF
ncbi:MAG: 4-hydroxythreonine-4-phosphate dehydrogenase PdxA [Planctomycetes bacterium]|nr:4-hydroxythreonine-4-phosphate dehydrogenase PdxA [Planctomycetota bacterium]